MQSEVYQQVYEPGVYQTEHSAQYGGQRSPTSARAQIVLGGFPKAEDGQAYQQLTPSQGVRMMQSSLPPSQSPQYEPRFSQTFAQQPSQGAVFYPMQSAGGPQVFTIGATHQQNQPSPQFRAMPPQEGVQRLYFMSGGVTQASPQPTQSRVIYQSGEPKVYTIQPQVTSIQASPMSTVHSERPYMMQATGVSLREPQNYQSQTGYRQMMSAEDRYAMEMPRQPSYSQQHQQYQQATMVPGSAYEQQPVLGFRQQLVTGPRQETTVYRQTAPDTEPALWQGSDTPRQHMQQMSTVSTQPPIDPYTRPGSSSQQLQTGTARSQQVGQQKASVIHFSTASLHKPTSDAPAGTAQSQPKHRDPILRPQRSMEASEIQDPPEFTSHPTQHITLVERDPFVITARVRPAGSSSLKVDWFKNFKPLTASSRYFSTLDRGYAVLEFMHTNPDDSGEYCCMASTAHGQAQSTGCVVNVIPEETVITESQLPEESMIANLAAMESQMMMNGTARPEEPSAPQQKPRILKPLKSQMNVRENSRVQFDTIIEPTNDSSLVVEWFKDGQPLTTGCRFTSIVDRGFAVLDIHYCYPEDSGDYYCVAKNSVYEVQSNVVQLSCKPEASIITDSTLSKESVNYLVHLDSFAVSDSSRAAYNADEELPVVPVFDTPLSPIEALEGSPIRLLVRAKGVPNPCVDWYINGDILPSGGGGSSWRVFSDGGISYLEFTRCGPVGEYDVLVKARNSLGEASSASTMVIHPQPDFRPDLKHVAPENTMKKNTQLRKVARTQELENAMSRPKAKALELKRLERGRSITSTEAEIAESMYSHVQASLRSRRNSQTPRGGGVVKSTQPLTQQTQPRPPVQTQNASNAVPMSHPPPPPLAQTAFMSERGAVLNPAGVQTIM